MTHRNWLILAGIFLLPFAAQSQRMWKGAYNRLGLKAGANHFSIVTDDLPSEANTSWTAGFTTRSDSMCIRALTANSTAMPSVAAIDVQPIQESFESGVAPVAER